MANRYVHTTITRQTKVASQKGFGTALILAISKVAAYKEYGADTAIADIGADFGAGSEESKLAAAILGQAPRVDKIAVIGILFTEGTDPVANLTGALNTLILSHNDWYFLTSTAQADASITALAGWINTQDKFYFGSTSNKALGAALNSLNTALLVHPQPGTYPAEAWVGVGAPRQIGTFTWTFKTLNGIAPAGYNETDMSAIKTGKGNTYITEGGVNITSDSKTTGGEWIDIIQGQHYLTARITEGVFALLANTEKVPFDDSGIALVVATIEKEIVGSGPLIARDENGKMIFSVTAPSRAEVSAIDRANRKLPGIKFSATIAGAIENVDITGTLLV